MSLTSTVLFDLPQREIASLIAGRIDQSISTSIVTGFATPGGLAAIASSIKSQPTKLATLVIGAATYSGFTMLDDLVAAGVPSARLLVHLGHTSESGARKNPFLRYHPMLHSKVYYMELSGSRACAVIGSHNVTSFALMGLNGEAAVMLEGPIDSSEFVKVRSHIDAARNQALQYSPGMKEAYAWWTREFIDGLKAEIKVPQDWTTVRTLLIFAKAAKADRPRIGDQFYFEIPAGIEQIDSLKTETHLFLFETLPLDPWQALASAASADAKYKCMTLGAENKQGNLEVVAQWRINETPQPVLERVPGGIFRPITPSGRQQVRAEVVAPYLEPFEYVFEREKIGWDPDFSAEETLHPHLAPDNHRELELSLIRRLEDSAKDLVLWEASGENRAKHGWKLVKNLIPRSGAAMEKDAAALRLASPDSGSFILVSLRRRKKEK